MRARTLLLALLLPACGGGDGGPGGVDGGPLPDARQPPFEDGIVERLLSIEGLTFVEQPEAAPPGYRFFALTFEQPADHAAPGGPKFTQQMTLLHRSLDAPMVLATDGYWIYTDQDWPEELTAILHANQLRVEHRFFPPSRPEPADWSLLTIAQAAADHHDIAAAFHAIYGGAWLATGASKGGMTAVYFRRFYPDDVDGTVAYVAPLSLGAPDPRYEEFFSQVGDESCRAALRDFQRAALTRRDELLPMARQQTEEQGYTFERVGGIEPAFEGEVAGLPWSFWQYADLSYCPDIPDPGASSADLYAFIDLVAPLYGSSDSWIDAFEPYYYQALSQLGYGDVPDDHIADLIQFPEEDDAVILPAGVTAVYDPAAMVDVAGWVAGGGERLLFIYGENDPWSAGAFDLGGAADSLELFVPDGNHGANLAALPEEEQSEALAALAAWTGVTPDVPQPATARERRPWRPSLRPRP